MQNKICLGTAQFGSRYGINNALDRQPTKQEVFDILSTAMSCGIDTIDTASAYGNAETLLGEFGVGEHSLKVISKATASDGDELSRKLRKTLDNLREEKIFGYLLHNAKSFYSRSIIDSRKEAKAKGLVKSIGVSVYEPEDALNVVRDADMDMVQVPYNVFDKRLDKTDFFEIAEKNNTKVFARSIFLQGLLLMLPQDAPDNLPGAATLIKKFRCIADSFGFTQQEAALLYVRCHGGIDCILFGVDTKEQLISNIEILNKTEDFFACFSELKNCFQDVKVKIISPNLWY